ncbi:sigma-54 dependent transcriptional regulator [Vibrio sp. JC009]|uniref:sigma-54-dependent transcriptional regulator n=1 Tax=Vibrio sp. JC009 TaxID=2912314 RepID=UPI0023AE9922|nr:sigma-54 dependent transcriptional regulator [Vibrio sp. JC009]WED20853.1 sigma-54 dependent transcriptional regulator [Vibrio sp. JC009]
MPKHTNTATQQNENSVIRKYQAISVLIVDDEEGMQSLLTKILGKFFVNISCASSIEEAEELRSRHYFDIVILDVNLPGRSGIEWNELFDDPNDNARVIFMTGYADLETTIAAIKLGASDFILKPFNMDQMIQSVTQCANKLLADRMHYAVTRDFQRFVPGEIIGQSEKTKKLLATIEQYAPSMATVLIQGESGTGKELVARGLHEKSGRSGPFVPVNCGAISEDLLESELFGHVANSRNGFTSAREGMFKVANSGTLFLDAVNEMPDSVQLSLLRVLEERKIRAVGSDQSIKIDVRIIAATNKNLKQEVAEGRFRKDLFYRLNVLQIDIAPLRERKADLGELASYFQNSICTENGITAPVWSDKDYFTLREYDWPGNIRELKNMVERCLLLGKSPYQCRSELNLDVGALQSKIHLASSHDGFSDPFADFSTGKSNGYPSEWTLKDVEKSHIQQVFHEHDGNKSAAAKQLGVSRKTLERKFKDWESQSG